MRSTADAAPAAGPDGPIDVQYDVYWTQPRDKRLLVLHFPNRDRRNPYSAHNACQPSALRLKPKSGLVELDVPLRAAAANPSYDAARGARYGAALRRNRTLAHGGAFGLAGGFGVGGAFAPAPARTGTGAAAADDDADLDDGAPPTDPETALARGQALNTVTLGGRVRAPAPGDPIYALGVFRGAALHLTRVDAFCALQPQLAHLDAEADNERARRRAAAAATRDPDDGGGGVEARAVNVTVKGADEEEVDVGEVAKTLRGMQEEAWETLDWVDEDDPRSFTVYQDQLMLADEGKGRGLVAALTPGQYLDAISAPRVDPTDLGKKVVLPRGGHSGDESSDKEEVVEVKIEEKEETGNKGKGKK